MNLFYRCSDIIESCSTERQLHVAGNYVIRAEIGAHITEEQANILYQLIHRRVVTVNRIRILSLARSQAL